MSTFAAIDFETANHSRDSACAVGVVVVSNGRIVDRYHQLIRPPSRDFVFTNIHGISWNDVARAPTFDSAWSAISQRIRGISFLAAHNAPFDKGVLNACCYTYGLPVPTSPFVCTVSVARSQWSLYPTKLPDVCRYLNISLKHHQADSDAEACAQIVIAAQKVGWKFRD